MNSFSPPLKQHLALIHLISGGTIPRGAVILILKKANPEVFHAIAEVCLNIPRHIAQLPKRVVRITRELASSKSTTKRRQLAIDHWPLLRKYVHEVVNQHNGEIGNKAKRTPENNQDS